MAGLLAFFILFQNPAPARVSFCAAGDILLDRGTRGMILRNGVDYPFEGIAELVRGFDLAYANLESPVSCRGRSTGKVYCFRGDTNFFPGIVNAGFDLISIANNHTIDWGQTAFFDTKEIIEKHGLIPIGSAKAGCGPAPQIVEMNGLRFAFFAAVGVPLRGVVWPLSLSGPCQADTSALAAAIRAVRSDVDFVVVGMHWGEEYVYRPSPENVRWAHALVEAGADLVLGSHPHILQSVEVYRDRLILYSLGNFVYDQRKTYQRQSGVFSCVFRKGKIDSTAFFPVFLNDFRPGLARGRDFDSISARLSEISRDYHARFRPSADRLFITDDLSRNRWPVPISRRIFFGRNCVVYERGVEYERSYGSSELGLNPGETIRDCAFIPDAFNPALAMITGSEHINRERLLLLRIEPGRVQPVSLPVQDFQPWKVCSCDLDGDSTLEVCVAGLKKKPFVSGRRNFLYVYEWRDGRLGLKSRAAKFTSPLLDFAFLDINSDRLLELVCLEDGGPAAGRDVNAYQWCGKGFYGYKTLTRSWSGDRLTIDGLEKLLSGK